MTGICAVYGFNDKNLIRRMGAPIRHRGKKELLVEDTDVSILTLTDQEETPLGYDTDQDVLVALDGEILNAEELHAKYDFLRPGQSDAEKIANIFSSFGESVYDSIEGSFCTLVVQKSKRRLTISRDSMGERALYYYRLPRDEGLLVASEIKSLLATELVPKRLSDLGLEMYFTYGYVPWEYTLIDGVKRAIPGHVSDPILNQQSAFWKIPPTEIQDSEEFWLSHFDELLKKSVAKRTAGLGDDLGIFLGGLDSATIAAILQRLYPDSRIKAVTVDTEDPEYNEVYAQETAEHLGLYHKIVLFETRMVPETLEALIVANDDLFANAVTCPQQYYGCQEAAKVSANFVAASREFLFWGGAPSFRNRVTAPDRKVFVFPRKMLGRQVSHAIFSLLRQLTDRRVFRQAELDTLFDEAVVGRIIRLWNSLYTDAALVDGFRYPSFHRKFESFMLENEVQVDPVRLAFKFKFMEGAYSNSFRPLYLWGLRTNLNMIFPFLDRQLNEVAWKIPWSVKTPLGKPRKYLRHKLAIKMGLPPDIVNQKKGVWTPPVSRWLRDRQVLSYFEEVLEQADPRVKRLLNYRLPSEFLDPMREDRPRGTYGPAVRRFRTALSFALWYKHFIA